MTATHGLFKGNETSPFFVGSQELVEHCLETLRDSFFFVAGDAKEIKEEFPFKMKPLRI